MTLSRGMGEDKIVWKEAFHYRCSLLGTFNNPIAFGGLNRGTDMAHSNAVFDRTTCTVISQIFVKCSKVWEETKLKACTPSVVLPLSSVFLVWEGRFQLKKRLWFRLLATLQHIWTSSALCNFLIGVGRRTGHAYGCPGFWTERHDRLW